MFGIYIYILKLKNIVKVLLLLFEKRASFLMWSNQVGVGPTVLNIFIKVVLNNVIGKLKTGRRSFLNLVFKHFKIRNITQTLLKEILYQTHCFFFYPHSFQWFVMLHHCETNLTFLNPSLQTSKIDKDDNTMSKYL